MGGDMGRTDTYINEHGQALIVTRNATDVQYRQSSCTEMHDEMSCKVIPNESRHCFYVSQILR